MLLLAPPGLVTLGASLKSPGLSYYLWEQPVSLARVPSSSTPIPLGACQFSALTDLEQGRTQGVHGAGQARLLVGQNHSLI